MRKSQLSLYDPRPRSRTMLKKRNRSSFPVKAKNGDFRSQTFFKHLKIFRYVCCGEMVCAGPLSGYIIVPTSKMGCKIYISEYWKCEFFGPVSACVGWVGAIALEHENSNHKNRVFPKIIQFEY